MRAHRQQCYRLLTFVLRELKDDSQIVTGLHDQRPSRSPLSLCDFSRGIERILVKHCERSLDFGDILRTRL